MNLRILFIEDSANDVELMIRRLREAGIEPLWERVESAQELRAALAGERWQVALVDYNLPGFSGPEALAVLAAVAPDVPAITVSGAITEETAVATIAAFAVDYVLKDNLTRLAPAVRRAVEGAELRRAHRQASEAARLALFAVDHASMSIMTVAADGTIVYVNDFACHEFGADRGDMVGAKVWDYDQSSHEATWPERWDALKESLVMEFEVDTVRRDGRRRILDVTANYLDGADCLISYGRDITDKRLAEERAAENEALYRRIVEMASEGIWAMDTEYVTTFVNPQMARMLGYEPEEMVGRADTDFAFEEDLPVLEAEGRAREQGLPGAYECRFKSKDGGEVWLHLSSVAEMAPDGEFLGAFALCTDITERRLAEEALRESEERFEEFADHFPGYLFMNDEERRCIYVNKPELVEGNVRRGDWLGKTSSDQWGAEEGAAVESRLQRAVAGEMFDGIVPWTASGRQEYLHCVYFPIIRRDKPNLVGGLEIDVTGQHEAEAEVRRQAEQLRRTVEGAVLAMSHVVETRDPYTAGHERRVSELATAIAAAMGMEGEELTALRHAGLIHDIGKIAVPAEILSKPGRLSDVEFNLITQHSATGFDILVAIDFGRPVAEMVLQHHERLDGSGYPRGLTGEDILPEARILAVADVVEAMSSHRPYRPALGMEPALAEIRAHAGVKYDADVVATCVRLVEEQGFQFTP